MSWFRPMPTTALPRSAPRWEGEKSAARVLVEHPDPLLREGIREVLTDAGYEVVTCGGPHASDVPGASCPLLRQEPCPAVNGADVVFSGLKLRDQVSRMILRRIAKDPCRPLVLTAPQREVDEYVPDVTDHVVFPLGSRRIVQQIDELTADR